MPTRDNKNTLDPLNLRILTRLAKDGRASYSELAKELRISLNTVRDRILSMERHGVIEGYRAILDERRVGNSVHVLALVRHASDAKPDLTPIHDEPRILKAHRTSGKYGLVLEMVASTMEEIHEALESNVVQHGFRVASLTLLGPKVSPHRTRDLGPHKNVTRFTDRAVHEVTS